MQTIANEMLYGLLVGSLRGLSWLPLRAAYWIGARLGDVAYVLLAERRRVTLQNLALAFGVEKTSRERRLIARATFRNLGRHLVDFGRLRDITAETFAEVCTIEGLDRVQHLLSRGSGLLVLSAHFGSWELVPAAALSLDRPVQVIVRPPDHPALRRLAEVYRQRCGYRSIPKREALSESLRSLQRGELVALLMDQSSLRREAVEVEFFGIKTFTPMGPALIALRSRCPVVSAFIVREDGGRHRLIISDEIPVSRTGDLRRDIEENTRRFNCIIESYIRCYPDHWFWLHRRWKQRPA
jgi:KDO2-lipid IV(A) lauroyltransferase